MFYFITVNNILIWCRSLFSYRLLNTAVGMWHYLANKKRVQIKNCTLFIYNILFLVFKRAYCPFYCNLSFSNISMWHRHKSILDHTNCFYTFINKKVQIIKFVPFIIFNTCKYLAYVFLLFCHSQGKKGQTTPLSLISRFFRLGILKIPLKVLKTFFLV